MSCFSIGNIAAVVLIVIATSFKRNLQDKNLEAQWKLKGNWINFLPLTSHLDGADRIKVAFSIPGTTHDG